MRRVIDRPLARVGAALAARGLRADTITWIGFLCGLAAAAALAMRADLLALGLLAVNRLADGLDGAVARHQGPTDFGGYLDIVLDFIVYSAIPFGFAVGRPEMAVPAAFLIFSFIGTGTSFLAFAVMAEKHGLSTDARGRKSLFYLGGLTEGTETILCLVAICLAPQAFAWIAYGFGALCWMTTAGRISSARTALRNL